MSNNNTSKDELRRKLREKIQGKRIGRKNKVQKKKELDSIANKMGISEENMKNITKMVNKYNKQIK